MMLYRNMVLEWVTEEEQPRLDRILWISTTGEDVIMFCLTSPTALPVWHKTADLLSALQDEQAHVLQDDPFQPGLIAEDALPPLHRQRRDRAWQLIAPLVTRPNPEPYSPHIRGRVLQAITKQYGCTKKTLYHYLRRYWQAGEMKNALLPQYDRCGGRGKTRQCGKAKRGRPSHTARRLGQATGMNVTEEVQTKFQKGIRLFYQTTQANTLRYAYQRTIEKLFHQGHMFSHGTWVPRLPSDDQLPTYGQFVYRKFTAIITPQFFRRGPVLHNTVESRDDIFSSQTDTHVNRQAFPRKNIQHHQSPKPTPIG